MQRFILGGRARPAHSFFVHSSAHVPQIAQLWSPAASSSSRPMPAVLQVFKVGDAITEDMRRAIADAINEAHAQADNRIKELREADDKLFKKLREADDKLITKVLEADDKRVKELREADDKLVAEIRLHAAVSEAKHLATRGLLSKRWLVESDTLLSSPSDLGAPSRSFTSQSS